MYAVNGFRYYLNSGPNMRIAILAAIVTPIAGFYFGITAIEWCFVVLSITLVIALEAVNTAVELLTDQLHPQQHPSIGRLKDILASAVLLASIGAAIIAVLIFGKYIVALFA